MLRTGEFALKSNNTETCPDFCLIAWIRATIPTSNLLKDPILKPLVDTPEMNIWMGPRMHMIGYCIVSPFHLPRVGYLSLSIHLRQRAKQEFNIVVIDPDDGSEESWKAQGNAEKMRANFRGWEPR
jgi:salicylate hydroxylase